MSPSEEPANDPGSLLQRIRDGDEEALTKLLLHYEPRIRTAAHVLLGPLLRPHLDSVDLVQSVHRVLLPGLRGGRYTVADPEQMVALAVTVIRRKIARCWRQLRREHQMQTQVRDQGVYPDKLTPSPAPAADPAQTAALNDGLRHLLAGLDAEERRLIELRLDGFSTVEIAAQMNCDANALRARLSRLRRRLRELGHGEWL
jgi:RNA polymerase sigma factor (sigma-70 family)